MQNPPPPPLEQLTDANGNPLVADDGTPLHVMVTTPTGTGPWPVVPVIHGGHWVIGNTYVGTVQAGLIAAGYATFCLEYRLAPPGVLAGQTSLGRYPDQTNDVEAQIAAIQRDSRCLFLSGAVGGSAGAYHALWLAAKELVPCAVAMSPATQLDDLGKAQPQADNYAPGNLVAASPNTIWSATSKDAMYICYERDQMPDTQRVDFIAALTALGITPNVTVIPGNGHAFNAWPSQMTAAIAFLNAHNP